MPKGFTFFAAGYMATLTILSGGTKALMDALEEGWL